MLIGNLCDIILCVLDVLVGVDFVFVEDMWVICCLFDVYEIDVKFQLYYDYNGEKIRLLVLQYLEDGVCIVLVFDVGMLLIFDLGFKLVCEVIVAGYEVMVIFGVLVVLFVLCVVGLLMDSFIFVGFLLFKVVVCESWMQGFVMV